MTDLRKEIESLIHDGLLPDREYISTKRFINHYADTNEFWTGLALVGNPYYQWVICLLSCFKGSMGNLTYCR
ncbi:Uncharacterised protein [Legionella pneumophila]|nr:Uncharacterised protein [Legionella pneumophila]CZH13162.1 Uncharacterised protein [Legionella pneumophila]